MNGSPLRPNPSQNSSCPPCLNLPILLWVVPAAGAGEVVGRGEAEVEPRRSLVRILLAFAVDPVRVVLARVRARLACEEKFHKLCQQALIRVIQY